MHNFCRPDKWIGLLFFFPLVFSSGLFLTNLNGSPLEEREKKEEALEGHEWAIVPHRPNYILPFMFSSNINQNPPKTLDGLGRYQDGEAEFQLSFKFLVGKRIFWDQGDFYFAYTQKSAWQIYDAKDSAPFRNTDYEPEIFFEFENKTSVFENLLKTARFGFNHQSNGQDRKILSRSWNRVYAMFFFEKDNFVWSLKPWWRIPESASRDDNPNMEKYLGYGEFHSQYKWHDYVFGVMVRNNLRISGNKGAIELGGSFPLYNDFKGYIKYFNGYADNLLDYNHPDQRVGIGIMLSDWL